MATRRKKKKSNKKLIISLIALAVVLATVITLCIVLSGDDEDLTGIETNGLLVENGIYKITVPNATTAYNILSKIKINEDATFEFSRDHRFTKVLPNGNIALNPGNNMIYLKVTDDNDNVSVYSFNIYRKKMFTVTYNVNGGSMANTSVKVEEGTVISAPSASKPGHSLTWDYDFKNAITGDVTINAAWTPEDRTINVDINGEITKIYLSYGDIPSGLPTPSKFGHTFAYWKYGDVRFDPNAKFEYDEKEITIVPYFEPIVYNIQYAIDKDFVTNNSGNVLSFTIVTQDGSEFVLPILAPTHSSANYEFLGWYTDENFTTLVDKITLDTVKDFIGSDNTLVLSPKWKISSNVTYTTDKGVMGSTTATFVYGEQFVLPTLEAENYIFDGWFYNGTKLSDGVWALDIDVELVAQWTPRENEIEYKLNGGANNANNPLSFNVEDGEITLLDPTYDEKHVFVGWYTNANFAEENRIYALTPSMVGTEVTLYAKWAYISTVTLNSKGGSCEQSSVDIKFGDTYTLPKPALDKYVFISWYYGTTPISLTGTWSYEQDVELVAKWEPKEFKINYELNGGTNNLGNKDRYTVVTDPNELMLLDPTKDYSTFGGWFLDAEFTQPITSIDPTMYEGVTVYALWVPIEATVNYDANGGSVSKENETVNLGDNYILPTPVRPGYKFDGWYDGDTLVSINFCWTNLDDLVIDLVAKWTIEEYEIKYNLDGGKFADSVTLVTKYTIDTETFKLPIPTKSGAYFVGWSWSGGSTSASMAVTKGSTGDREYTAIWTTEKDSNGLLYKMIDGKMVVVGIDRAINDSIIAGIKIPATHGGVEVVAIESNAFKEFGERFTKTSYANMSNSYVTFQVPTSVKRIGANAFDSCNGIKVTLYDPNSTVADHQAWDKTVVWEAGNSSARDCIWGFRPAIGWTRYSKAEIPDDYE